MDFPDTKTLYGFALGLGCGLCIAIAYRGRIRSKAFITTTTKSDIPEAAIMGETGEYKLVLVVRSDLKMGKGKIAAQCSHAAVMSYKQLSKVDPELLSLWEYSGQPKVVTKTDSEESLLELANHARQLGLAVSLVRDAGRTQIAPGSKTVLGVGPGPAHLVDEVTGALKLF